MPSADRTGGSPPTGTTSALEAEARQHADEMQTLAEMVQNCIGENARIAQNQEKYQKRCNDWVSRCDAVKEQHDAAALRQIFLV